MPSSSGQHYPKSTLILLVAAYIVTDTCRADLSYAVVRLGSILPSEVIVASAEIFKLLVVHIALLRGWTAFVGKSDANASRRIKSIWEHRSWGRQQLWLAIPSSMYFTNNLLYFKAMQSMSAFDVHVWLLLRFPLTAILHHFVIRYEQRWQTWTALAFLFAGLLSTQMRQLKPMTDSESSLSSSALGVALCLLISLLSAGASILTETLLKSDSDFAERQIWLYFWGSLIGCVSVIFFGAHRWLNQDWVIPLALDGTGSTSFPLLPAIATILLTGIVGLLVAFVLRYLDSIWKSVATGLTLVLIALSNALIWKGEALQMISERAFITGAIVICVASWTYSSSSKIVNIPLMQGKICLGTVSSSTTFEEENELDKLCFDHGDYQEGDDDDDNDTACFNTSQAGQSSQRHLSIKEKSPYMLVFGSLSALLLVGILPSSRSEVTNFNSGSTPLHRLITTTAPHLKSSSRSRLFAVKTGYSNLARRDIIRRTWGKDLISYPSTDLVFYVARPLAHAQALIDSEIEEYGDIIILEHLKENHAIATSVKSMEFFKVLARNTAVRYDWVMHVDDDSFVNVKKLMSEHLLTEELNSPQKIGGNGIICRMLGKGFGAEDRWDPYPAGPFYGLTWPLMMIVSQGSEFISEYALDGSFWRDDDVMVGFVIRASNTTVSATHFRNSEEFQLVESTGAYDPEEKGFPSNCLHPDAIIVHDLKSDARFMWVAGHFAGVKGWTMAPRFEQSDKCDRKTFPECTCPLIR